VPAPGGGVAGGFWGGALGWVRPSCSGLGRCGCRAVRIVFTEISASRFVPPGTTGFADGGDRGARPMPINSSDNCIRRLCFEINSNACYTCVQHLYYYELMKNKIHPAL